jgi:hypothetical protein
LVYYELHLHLLRVLVQIVAGKGVDIEESCFLLLVQQLYEVVLLELKLFRGALRNGLGCAVGGYKGSVVHSESEVIFLNLSSLESLVSD